MENNTARNFVLQLGSLISLYLSVIFLLVLCFSIINLLLPDAAEGVWALESASSSIRLGIAMLVVFFPCYIILTRLVNEQRRETADSTYLGLTKWLIYLTLLVGGLVLLSNVVAVLLAFLDGELTLRFILKAVSLFVIVGATFYYYVQDARGYWLTREPQSKLCGLAVSLVVVGAIIFGITQIETPAGVREIRIDTQQVMDLQTIQYQIENYYLLKNELPASLSDITTGPKLPVAEERDAYSYERTENGFKLCATFARASQPEEFGWLPPIDETAAIINRDDWTHGEGRHCFERVIN